jgi:PadR family transcriptional regulator, regulatory protein PadR
MFDTQPHLSYGVCQMARGPTIGQFEQLVLTAVLSLRDDAYGVSIHGRVAELAAPKVVSLGAVYVTLDRLEDKGFVTSWLSDPTPERGGRAKRCYRLQALGERVLRESAESVHRMHEVLSAAWGGRRWKPARIR